MQGEKSVLCVWVVQCERHLRDNGQGCVIYPSVSRAKHTVEKLMNSFSAYVSIYILIEPCEVILVLLVWKAEETDPGVYLHKEKLQIIYYP